MTTTETHNWIRIAAGHLDGRDVLAAPDALYFWHAARLEPEAWTPVKLSECWARLQPYREVLKAANIRWRPAPTFVADGPVVADETLIATVWQGKFALLFPFGHDCTPAVRAIEGCRWNKDARAWLLDVTEAGAEAVRGLAAGAGFTIDDMAEIALAEIAQHSAEQRMASRATAGRFAVDGLACELRPYQAAGVEYLVKARRAFLADDMGLGKTVQALAAVQSLGAWPALVVTLASVKGGWAQECAQWLPGVRVVTWDGRSKGETPHAVEPVVEGERVLHVINYDLLQHRLEELQAMRFRAAIFDEIHHLKNGKAKRTLAARKLVGGPKKGIPVRFGLSGTPVQNLPQELISQLGILGRLDDLGGFWKFGMRYCGAKQTEHGWDFSGSANLGELHERLRGLCFVRRTKAQVLAELPPKILTTVPIGMTAEGWARYDVARKDITGWLAGKAAMDPAWEATIAHLSADQREEARGRRLAEAVEKLDGMDLLLRLGTLRQVAAEGKVKPAMEWIREMCACRKLVLFAHHRVVLRALLEEFRGELGALLIDGDTPAGKRQGLVTQFAKPGHQLMLLNLTAGGTGLNGLQHSCGDVAFLEWPWSPGSVAQAADRLHRIGQRNSVHVWHLVAPGTVDTELLAILASKAKICAGANDGIEARQAAVDIGRTLAGRFTHG